ncbi:hypothetical protein QAD02_007376 [Eretmocerus hayati]|uniref:Uncharacterized protein n=1 Tax=Eretmocerus hayati TaxID=131215 RepID=A0ACC2N3S2_9HYME|nr:hypothetical protein QAD02_007376 [Eretmocerus hayati]
MNIQVAAKSMATLDENVIQNRPLGLSFNRSCTSTVTAGQGSATTTTLTYQTPITTSMVKRSRVEMPTQYGFELTDYMDNTGQFSSRRVAMNFENRTRSVFTSTTRDFRCIGPAVGVFVDKISTNPLFAPQSENQKKLFEVLMTKNLKIGLLKSEDGRVIMNETGSVLLQPDRLGWRCGNCCLKHPEKYNKWQGWMVHEVNQVGILDEYPVVMICADCGNNALSPYNLDNCVDAVITCARHWEDVNKGVIMEVLPICVDCLCSQMTAQKLQDHIDGARLRRYPK